MKQYIVIYTLTTAGKTSSAPATDTKGYVILFADYNSAADAGAAITRERTDAFYEVYQVAGKE